MANGGEESWWMAVAPYIWGLFAAIIGPLVGAVTWIVRDRIAVKQMLDEHDATIQRLIDINSRWEDGYAHERNIAEVRSEVDRLAIQMSSDVQSIRQQLDHWFGWFERNKKSSEH